MTPPPTTPAPACACAAPDEPSSAPPQGAVRLALGHVEATYTGPGEEPRIAVAGRRVPIEAVPPARDRTPNEPLDQAVFALSAGTDSVLVSDRAARLAVLVPRDAAALSAARPAPLYAALPDPRRAGRFRVTVHATTAAAGPTSATAATGALYVAQAFGHTTGWVPAVHAALAALAEPVPFTAAIRRQEDAAHARRKAGGTAAGLHVVPLRYDDTESATITPADVANPSRPELANREAALLWIADNLELAQAASGAAAIVNDCRPETWILHRLAEHAQRKDVPLHVVRYAFEEFADLRALAAEAAPPTPETHAGARKSGGAVAELLAASAPAIHTRAELLDALRASGTDPLRNPSVDFEAASREIIAGVPAGGTVWYQAVDWRGRLSLEEGGRPYVVVPPLGEAGPLCPEEAAQRAGAVLAERRPELRDLFAPGDPRGVVLVSQGNGFSARSRRHWRGMLALAARMEETHFLFAGGSAQDRAWLACEAERRPRANVTLLGWVDEHWSTFLRALRAKPRAAFVCRPGLSSIGAALVNGVPPLLMPPDPLTGPDGSVDAVTAEVAMERAVYAFQLERLYAARCARHHDTPPPVIVDTLSDDPAAALDTLRRAVDPDVQTRARAALDGYCDWSRVAHLIARVLAQEAASGPLPIGVKRRLRDELLAAHEPLAATPEPQGAIRQVPPPRDRRAGAPVTEHE